MTNIIKGAKIQTKFNICTVIRKILLEDETVQSYVGKKIYPIQAPEQTEGDYIVYQRDEYSIDRTKAPAIVNQTCVVYISVVSPDYDNSNIIADAVFQALDGKYNINEDKQSIREILMDDSTEDKVGDKYIQTLRFIIK